MMVTLMRRGGSLALSTIRAAWQIITSSKSVAEMQRRGDAVFHFGSDRQPA